MSGERVWFPEALKELFQSASQFQSKGPVRFCRLQSTASSAECLAHWGCPSLTESSDPAVSDTPAVLSPGCSEGGESKAGVGHVALPSSAPGYNASGTEWLKPSGRRAEGELAGLPLSSPAEAWASLPALPASQALNELRLSGERSVVFAAMSCGCSARLSWPSVRCTARWAESPSLAWHVYKCVSRWSAGFVLVLGRWLPAIVLSCIQQWFGKKRRFLVFLVSRLFLISGFRFNLNWLISNSHYLGEPCVTPLRRMLHSNLTPNFLLLFPKWALFLNVLPAQQILHMWLIFLCKAKHNVQFDRQERFFSFFLKQCCVASIYELSTPATHKLGAKSFVGFLFSILSLYSEKGFVLRQLIFQLCWGDYSHDLISNPLTINCQAVTWNQWSYCSAPQNSFEVPVCIFAHIKVSQHLQFCEYMWN